MKPLRSTGVHASPSDLIAAGVAILAAHWRHSPIWLWPLAGLLLMASAVLQFGWRPSLQDQSHAAASTPAKKVVQAPDLEAAEELAAVWAALPSAAAMQADLSSILDAGRSTQLVIQRAQLRRTEMPPGLVAEDVEIEIDAPYPQIRRFLARCLNRLPHASLRKLRLQRDDAGQGSAPSDALGTERVRAILVLRLHYREGAHP